MEGILKVKIKSPPEKGKANEELLSFLADTFKIAKNRFRMISGHSSRLKKLEIEDFEMPEKF